MARPSAPRGPRGGRGMKPRVSVTRRDAVLGTVRGCPGCREWWPDDGEFFYAKPYAAGEPALAAGRLYDRRTSGVTYRCKACHAESKRRSRTRMGLRTA